MLMLMYLFCGPAVLVLALGLDEDDGGVEVLKHLGLALRPLL